MSTQWTSDGYSMTGENGDFRLRVNSSVSGTGWGGFIYHKNQMLFSDTYSNIGEAQRDLEQRVIQERYRLQPAAPEPAYGAGAIAKGYVLDDADVAAINYLTDASNIPELEEEND